MKKEDLKKRIFDILQIGKRTDFASRAFDFAVVSAVLLNCAVLFLETFEELQSYHGLLKGVEIVTIIFFCIEYALRIWTADYLYPNVSKGRAIWKFLWSFDGIVDLFTILPFFYLSGFVAFRMLRVIRILRLFQINAIYDSFNVITEVLREKKNQILSSVVIILVLMMASSLSMYSVEHEIQPEVFKNAFSGLWWSLSTIFTVGYGDIYPVTALGRVLAVFTTFLGVGVVAIPTGIISAGFVENYTQMSKMAPPDMESARTETFRIEDDSFYCEKTVGQLSKMHGIRVIVIIRDGKAMIPTRNMMIEEDDIVVLQR